jgi:predicted ATPase
VKIGWLKLQNYKSYSDSGEIEFAPDFTVIVGKNNSGKSALLQGLRFRSAGPKPHRSPLVDRDVALDPSSKFGVEVLFEWDELENVAGRAAINRIVFPVNQNETDRVTNLQESWRQFVSRRTIKIPLTWPSDQQNALALHWPSHGQFADPSPNQRVTMCVDFHLPSREWRFAGIVGNEENLPQIATEGLTRQIFVFDAERLNIDVSGPQAGQTLNANASNLPTLLHEMQANPHLWAQFIQHVGEVFPQITSITTPPVEGSGQISISVWQVDTETRRDDLAVRLKECGTGVGQVLAILYIAMTRTGNVIAIDEPNSFLHPGASRKLIEILKQYDKNQYVIATHSADLITAIRPEILHQVTWDAATGESKVRRIDQSNMDDVAELLSDLGVRLSDVFGAERIIWVEGQTEAACFPILAGRCDPSPPLGTVFVAVRATGDFDAKSADAKKVWDIYKRLTERAALVPPAIAFSFDREKRTQAQMDELKKISKGKVSFLPRRLLENHFLHVGAIQHAIAGEYQFRAVEGAVPSVEELAAAINLITTEDPTRNKALDWSEDQEWVATCHGAKLFESLFAKYDLTYSKIRHGEQIVKWLSTNAPDHLAELIAYLTSLWNGVVEPA